MKGDALQPNLARRKQYWLYAYAFCQLEWIMQACDSLSTESHLHKHVKQMIFFGIVATYAKPFLNCNGVGKLPSNIVPKEFQKIHELLIVLRHRAIGHLDACGFQADDPQFGNLNRVKIRKGDGLLSLNFIAPDDSLVAMHQVKALCVTLRKKINNRLNEFEHEFLEGNLLPPGSYLLNVDAHDTRAFVPTSA